MRIDRRHLAVGVVAAIGLAGTLAYVRREQPARAGETLPDWCAPGLEPIPGGCFAKGGDQGLIVYLHGRYTPETQNEEIDRQARVARMASARGFSVLAFRGKQGACIGPELASYWCWPSNERTQDAGPEVVAAWQSVLLQTPEKPRYLLGFSNGGYFASLIATRNLAAFDAIAIVGAGPVEPTRALGPKPPILLVTADEDGALDEMLRLEFELEREAWPHLLTSREGGHALTDFDVGTALDFFMKKKIAPRRPIKKVIDEAGVEDAPAPEEEDDASTF